MKNLARCLVILFLMNFSVNLYAQEWIPYQQVQTQTVFIPAPQPQPIVIYQWVPYTIQQNIIVERRCFLHSTQTIVSRPTIQWVLQPTVIYK